jgi:hypothetical protein
LGHIILEEGVAVDPEKIKFIEGWPIPNNVSKVRSFMGLAGYCRIFIEDFSNIANPITSLQNKGVRFEWTPDCERRFQHLKNLLEIAPILRIIDPNEDYVLCTDA